MRHINYKTSGTCSFLLNFDLDDDNNIHNLVFLGGCNGNLKAIAKLVEGKKAIDIANILKGNTCGNKSTSCSDQLAKAIYRELNVN